MDKIFGDIAQAIQDGQKFARSNTVANDNDPIHASTTEQRRQTEYAIDLLLRDHNAAKLDEKLREAATTVFGGKHA